VSSHVRAGLTPMNNVVFKPISESIERYNPPYTPKLPVESICLSYGTLIAVGDTSISLGEKLLYTVPAGKVFILFAGSMSHYNNSGLTPAPSRLNLYSKGSATLAKCLCLLATPTGGATITTSLSFPVPVKAMEGDSIYFLNANANNMTGASIVGYEIDSALFFSNL